MLVESWPVIFVTTEYFHHGLWLDHIVKEIGDGGFESYTVFENMLLKVFRDVAAGLASLHSQGVLHLSVTLEHLYITSGSLSDGVKIGGCLVTKKGFTAMQLSRGEQLSQLIDPVIAPPEILNDQALTSKTDAWMLGCAVYEALLLWQRCQARSAPHAARAVVRLKEIRGILQEIPIATSPALRSLLRMLLHPNPTQRPHLSQVVDHLTFARATATQRLSSDERDAFKMPPP
ncbi:hypothetical protein PINS_up005089 [Pythium insidiosum]|nr:hypothetical protein PINS_up005089 [Pythium insidiosum]